MVWWVGSKCRHECGRHGLENVYRECVLTWSLAAIHMVGRSGIQDHDPSWELQDYNIERRQKAEGRRQKTDWARSWAKY
jgi:hypothetical protein